MSTVVLRKGLRFERGFLTACEANFRLKGDLARVAGDRTWATVEELIYAPATIYLHPVMRSLRSLGVNAPDVIVSLCTGERQLEITKLTVSDFLLYRHDDTQLESPAEQLAALAAARCPSCRS